MDNKRSDFHRKIVEVFGNSNVYFQPSENVKLTYPCVIYDRVTGNTRYADDNPYIFKQIYDVTYISRDPDDGMVSKFMTSFPGIRYDRHFVSDNLHHDTFRVPNYEY